MRDKTLVTALTNLANSSDTEELRRHLLNTIKLVDLYRQVIEGIDPQLLPTHNTYYMEYSHEIN